MRVAGWMRRRVQLEARTNRSEATMTERVTFRQPGMVSTRAGIGFMLPKTQALPGQHSSWRIGVACSSSSDLRGTRRCCSPSKTGVRVGCTGCSAQSKSRRRGSKPAVAAPTRLRRRRRLRQSAPSTNVHRLARSHSAGHALDHLQRAFVTDAAAQACKLHC